VGGGRQRGEGGGTTVLAVLLTAEWEKGRGEEGKFIQSIGKRKGKGGGGVGGGGGGGC